VEKTAPKGPRGPIRIRVALDDSLSVRGSRDRAVVEELIAAALLRGDLELRIPAVGGGTLVYDLSTWPQVRDRLLQSGH